MPLNNRPFLKFTLTIGLLLFSVLAARAAPLPDVRLLGEMSLFTPREMARLKRSAKDVAHEAQTPVCVVVWRKTKPSRALAQFCAGAVVVGVGLNDHAVLLQVPGSSPLAHNTPGALLKNVQQKDMVPLLRKGRGADGLVNGLEALVLAAQGRYHFTPPSFVQKLWPLVFMATVLRLLGIAASSRGRGRGEGWWLHAGGAGSDLALPLTADPPTPAPAHSVQISLPGASGVSPTLSFAEYWSAANRQAVSEALENHPHVHLHAIASQRGSLAEKAQNTFMALNPDAAKGLVLVVRHRPFGLGVAAGSDWLLPEETLRKSAALIFTGDPQKGVQALLEGFKSSG